MRKLVVFYVCFVMHGIVAKSQTVDGLPAAIPPVPGIYKAEPWEDPLVTSINREPARATAYYV